MWLPGGPTPHCDAILRAAKLLCMIPVKPLHVELTQPLHQELPGQRASSEDSQQRGPLTRGLTRTLPPAPTWTDEPRGDDAAADE